MSEQLAGYETIQSDPEKDRYWGNADELLKRLCPDPQNPYRAPMRPVVFLVGAALSQPDLPTKSGGVPNTREMIKLLQDKLEVDETRREQQDKNPYQNQVYQELFDQFYNRSGPEGVKVFLRHVVSQAYMGPEHLSDAAGEQQCSKMEDNLDEWLVPPGTEALGTIVSEFPQRFGRYLLTTNFDPLLAVAIRRARGRVIQTALHGDSNPGSLVVRGTHLVHFHGYWYRDQLHKPERHAKTRRNLNSFFQHLLHHYTIVVMGYGGWEDEFTTAVKEVVAQFDAKPDVLWCVGGEEPNRKITDELSAGIARGRVCFYTKIDCNRVLPSLLNMLHKQQEPQGLQDAWKKCYARYTSNDLLTEGVWVLVSSHGPRYTLKLERGGDLNSKGQVTASPLFDDRPKRGAQDRVGRDYPTLGFLEGHQKLPIWWFETDRRLVIKSEEENYGLQIPDPLNGTFHWCREYFGDQKQNNQLADLPDDLKNWCNEWTATWKNKWKDRQHIDDRARALLGWSIMEELNKEKKSSTGGQSVTQPCAPEPEVREPVTAFYVAIHLIPWPTCADDVVSVLNSDTAIQGHWIKFGKNGGTYVVKLNANGELLEWDIFDVTRQMSGRWWIDGEKKLLNIWLRNWCLTYPLKDHKNPTTVSPGTPDSFFVDCVEKEAGSERVTEFKVAHLLSCFYADSVSRTG